MPKTYRRKKGRKKGKETEAVGSGDRVHGVKPSGQQFLELNACLW